MNRFIAIILLFTSLLFLFPSQVDAAFSFNIASSSANFLNSGSQEVEVWLNINSLPSESYFRVSLQKEGGGSYYGYILNNNGDWAKIMTLSGDCAAYYKVSDTSVTILSIKYKIGDDSEISNGNYNLKAHRFTKTCTSYTEATNLLPFVVDLPTPTPSPTTDPTPSPTPMPTPTKTPTPVKTPTPTKTPTPKPTPTPEILGEASGSGVMENISGLENSPNPTPDIDTNGAEGKFPFIAIIFVGSGVILIGIAIYLMNARKNNPQT